MKRFLDIYVPILLSFFFILFSYIALKDNYDISVIGSFWLLIIMILILMIISFKKKYSYFDMIMLIFYVLFFLISPIIQLNKGYYPIPFIIKQDLIIFSNLYNSIFIIIYIAFRYINFTESISKEEEIKEFKISKFTKKIMATIFFIYFIPNLPGILSSIINRTIDSSSSDQVYTLIINKFIMLIPLFFTFYYLNEYKNNKKNLTMLLFWLVILIICKNPFNEKRNGIFSVYSSLILFIVIKKYNARKFFLVITTLFIIIFPLSSFITHSSIGLIELINGNVGSLNLNSIILQFQQLHFDAFANFNVIVEYVNNNSISFGIQFLGSLLFFIPRSLWINKPWGTGTLVGNYLIDYYGFNFNNLSAPITAEAYINFGIIGVVIFAIFFSIWSKLTSKWLKYKNYYTLIAWFMITHVFYLMRGDLMNGIAYLIGPLCATYFMPLGLEKVRNILKKNK